ncbi:MAG: thioesterase family protein [Candidatus Omnitrophota bacterium]
MSEGHHKIYKFDKISPFFKHTDYYGYVHPYNYYEWTSYVRERFFQDTVSNFLEVMSRPIKMMTAKINCSVLAESVFGHDFEARLMVGRIKKVSFDMVIRFFDLRQRQVVCETQHTVVFVDSRDGSFSPIPIEMLKVIVDYLERK